MWSKNMLLEILWANDRVIYGEFREGEGLGTWRAYFCHGTPYTKEKCIFWNQLESDVNN